jgi:hypothetical protein
MLSNIEEYSDVEAQLEHKLLSKPTSYGGETNAFIHQ